MQRRTYSSAIGTLAVLLSLLLIAGCYPFQGDVSAFLTPVPTVEVSPEELEAAMASVDQAASEATSEAEAAPMAEIAARSLRVRQEPNTDTPVIAGLREGDQVEIVGKNADSSWLQVQVPDVDTIGWVSAEYVNVIGDLAAVPVTTEGETMAAGEEATAEPTAEATAEPEMAATPTEGTPSVTVENQEIVDGTVTVAQVVAAQDGWIVIHADDGGTFGAVIGHAAVTAGTNTDVTVTIDTAAATETLYAMLHVDAGEAGVYEFPGPDVPVVVDGAPVSPAFQATGGMTESEMAAEPTAEPTPEEMATAEEATAEPTAEEMATEEATSTPEAEATPAEATPEAATYRVDVRDQVLDIRNVTVPEVVTAQDGWIVIHIAEEGAPGTVLGYAPVQAGTNSRVIVTLDRPVENGTELFAMLHVDAGEMGTYEFPGPDAPVVVDGETVMTPFVVLTPAIRVEDQTVEENSVTIPAVVTARDSWLVIHESNDDGTVKVPDSIGIAPIAPGTTPNVKVELEKNVADGAQLWAMLHYDAGEKGTYEFPGPDEPITVENEIVMTPFVVSVPEAMAGGEEAAPPSEEMPAEEGMDITAEVATRSLRVRLGPDLDAPVIAGIERGETYKVAGKSADGEWLALVIPDLDINGWVSTDLVDLSVAIDDVPVMPILGVATVNTGGARLRVRDIPSVDGDIVGYLSNGSKYTAVVESEDGNWVLLIIPTIEGQTWVAKEYVTIE